MNYLMAKNSKLSTLELISKTQVMTSVLLDMHKVNDFELKNAFPSWPGYFRQELAAKEEVKSLIKKANADQLEICKKYDMLNLIKALQYKWEGAKVNQALVGMRALLKVELQLLYPLIQNEQILMANKWTRIPELAQKNKFHKSDIDVQLSSRFPNEILRQYRPLRNGDIPQKISTECLLEDCASTDINFSYVIEKTCDQEKPQDNYGW
ncbi:hypothetical protein D3C72_1446730 [compost metagenome]